MRIPKHVGIIPDGNRRWAVNNGLNKEEGYNIGLTAGLKALKDLQRYNVREIIANGQEYK